MRAARDRLANFIDTDVIDRNFKEGFPDNAILSSTLKRKKNKKIGEETGRLRAKATSFTSYQLFEPKVGTRTILFKKKKSGLTPYSHLVSTSIGGEIDFLEITADDLASISTKFAQIIRSLGYGSNGKMNLLKKSVPDEEVFPHKRGLRKKKVRGVNVAVKR